MFCCGSESEGVVLEYVSVLLEECVVLLEREALSSDRSRTLF